MEYVFAELKSQSSQSLQCTRARVVERGVKVNTEIFSAYTQIFNFISIYKSIQN